MGRGEERGNRKVEKRVKGCGGGGKGKGLVVGYGVKGERLGDERLGGIYGKGKG